MKFLHELEKHNDGRVWDNGYWEIINDPPYKPGKYIQVENRYGGKHFHMITEDDEIINSDWQTVNRKYYLNKSDSLYGWIDKDGTFFGCDYFEHNDCAQACFGMYEGEAERAGYVKIYQDNNGLTYYHEGFLTDAQRQCVINRGIELFIRDRE